MTKKTSAASKYEVKIPNGVAGIRGCVWDISAEGLVKVFSGSVVLAYVGPDGTVVTQAIMGLQQFDARTGVLSQLSDLDKSGLGGWAKESLRVLTPTPISYSLDRSLKFVSPH
jgi:hypothetical protein